MKTTLTIDELETFGDRELERAPGTRSTSKGSLVDARPDDLVAFAIDAALKQVPELDRGDIVDMMVGCGFPQERQGMNLAAPP